MRTRLSQGNSPDFDSYAKRRPELGNKCWVGLLRQPVEVPQNRNDSVFAEMVKSATGSKFIFLLLGFLTSLLAYGVIFLSRPQDESVCCSIHTNSSQGKEPKNHLLEKDLHLPKPTKPMMNSPVSEPCMQQAISFKEDSWSTHEEDMSSRQAKFNEAVSCIQKAYEELASAKRTK